MERSAAGPVRYAHRLAYERAKGSIPAGLQIDHLCRVRECVNPDHLEAVSQRENIRRGKGTKLTPEDVRTIKRSHDSSEALAKRFGVTAAYVEQIRKGKVWTDVV